MKRNTIIFLALVAIVYAFTLVLGILTVCLLGTQAWVAIPFSYSATLISCIRIKKKCSIALGGYLLSMSLLLIISMVLYMS